jgi:quercetin dioxygenase-like cupin family protein
MSSSTVSRAPSAPGLKVVQPGEGAIGTLLPGVGVQFKLHGRDTGGQLSIVEHPFAVGALVPPHLHTREDEISIVLEGEIGFRSEDKEVVLGPGAYIIKPHGEVHAMWNAGRVPARMIEIITPPGFEDFFREVADLIAADADVSEHIGALGERYGLPFPQPDWLPGVIARYGLTPAGR